MPIPKVEQWGWSHMEELLQCPVCLEPPFTGIVVQCRSGHHICATCKLQIDDCPLCKRSFSGTRNFVVEEIMRNYLVLKNIMLLTAITNEEESEVKSKVIPKKINYTTINDKGVYPCRINECNVKLPSCRLLNHVRTYHPSVLTEDKIDAYKIYTQNWQFTYEHNKPVNRMCQAVFISGIGIIFLNLEILNSGCVIIVVQMGAQLKTTKEYKVCISVYNENRLFCHNTKVPSARESMRNLLFKKACLLLTQENIASVLQNNKFNCSIKIKPFENENDTISIVERGLVKSIYKQRVKCLEQEKLLQYNESKKKSNNKKKTVQVITANTCTENGHSSRNNNVTTSNGIQKAGGRGRKNKKR